MLDVAQGDLFQAVQRLRRAFPPPVVSGGGVVVRCPNVPNLQIGPARELVAVVSLAQTNQRAVSCRSVTI